MQALLQLQGICGVQVTLGQDLSEYFSFSLSFVLPLMLRTLFLASSAAGTIYLSVAAVPSLTLLI